ncbi:Membralin protein [Dioscorea alata]|uniref:Membralin protein n=1 Tax=Dioscorea alata TaxID=55571 RepID=A0ACB7VWF7_DIOAL|nr:Membralin protein [Dioscorea alata]
MDPEQTFLRVHARLSGMLSQLLTPRIRATLEYLYLGVAVALFCVLVVMHTNFVQQPGCSNELSVIEFTEAHLVQIKITGAGLWSQSPAYQSMVDIQKQESSVATYKMPDVNGDGFTIFSAKFWSSWIGSDITSEVGDLHIARALSARESFKVAVGHLFRKVNMQISSYWKNARKFSANARQVLKIKEWNMLMDISKFLQMFQIEHLKAFLVQWLEKRSNAFEPTYLYTVEKGYFLLPEAAKSRHNLQTVNITLSAQNSCFGNRWQQLLINSFVGYDTILMNSLLNSPGQGYLYNYQTKEFYDLSYGHEPSEGSARFGDYFVTKCGVLIMSLFVFFTTTMSVSFTLRETQSRMLRFTVQLQHHARHRLPTFQLIFVHVIESLVFVPIMIGILFFLFEFYDDQLLAFLVLTLVWLCELFTLISVRTPISMQFFPRFFLLYFLVFHIYFFSYSYGFSYLAFSTTAAFMQHLILYFWNRFEVPALQRYTRTRAQLHQQPGVSIYTSTLIARVNVRNANTTNTEPETGTEPGSGPDQIPPYPIPNTNRIQEQTARNTTSNSNSNSEILQFPDLNPPREAGAAGFNLPNPLSSILLWILGGASSEGIISFFSMFRDPRDQPPGYTEPPATPPQPPAQQEENPVT